MSARLLRGALILALTALLGACASAGHMVGLGSGRGSAPRVVDPAPVVAGTMRPYQVRGRWYRPSEDAGGYNEVGMASWYGDQFNGRPTASGERFDMHALTAAHKTLPLPALVEVTNLANGRTVVVRVNDRGPFSDNRIIDLSRGAAESLDMLSRGVGQVRVRYLGPAPRGGGTGVGAGFQIASNDRPREPERRRVRESDSDPSRYWVQAGSFIDPLAAQLTAESLGGRARVTPARVEGRRMYRVLVGPWDDANSAERARQTVMAQGVHDALLISGD